MVRIEAIQFQDDGGVEVRLSFGNPPKVEGIVFHSELERSTPASTISDIFWAEPTALRDIIRGVNEFSANNLLDPHRTCLLGIATGRIEEFIEATRVYPGED